MSGGSVRGLAHIGVLKVLTEAGIHPAIVAGASAGSIIGAGIAAGMTWQDLIEMARGVFWPKLLHGDTLERFCARHLPHRFSDLRLPFAAIATALPGKRAIALTTGHLASAINASCAMRVIRGRVRREGHVLKDGGIACVLPADVCRQMGADFVISSDVWEVSSVLRDMGFHPAHRHAHRVYPAHYRTSLRHTDLHIHPRVPIAGYWPGDAGIKRMVAAGELAARRALERFSKKQQAQMPEGNVSAGSPIFHSDVRSSGSTARV
ncbi:MAG: patatin-like phospholipase family protein [Acidobacteriia bacterium]|nr:patatin-like phospholipase family protein [Terriglobia bacterium]